MKRRQQASKARPKKSASTRKSQYRIRNWHDYNESLVQRGSITLWISEEDIGAWKPDGPRKRGGQVQYSDGAIQCLLMVRSVFHLTLRATEGFLRSLFHLLEWELPVPDYTTLCKRARRLGVSLGRKAAGPLHLVLDSTGLKVFGEGEWKVRQHGYTKRARSTELLVVRLYSRPRKKYLSNSTRARKYAMFRFKTSLSFYKKIRDSVTP